MIISFNANFVSERGRKSFEVLEGNRCVQGNQKHIVFYDGPPFATGISACNLTLKGLPHYGHLLAGTIKDVVTRYAHSTGHYVERRNGWDTHGLPVEYEIDKSLGIFLGAFDAIIENTDFTLLFRI